VKMPKRRRLAIAAAVTVLICGGCGKERDLSLSGYAGAELPQPKPKPAFVLTSMHGGSFDFRRETDGFLTLLFFGYTNCPDVCPVQMSNLAAALDRLPSDLSRRVRVVFVTTDPARDTPARLRQWLGAFAPSFVGLTGTPEQLTRAQLDAGLPPAVQASIGDSATARDYTVGHAAQIIAYTPDNLERVHYPSGTRQQDWAHDIPLLLQRDRQ